MPNIKNNLQIVNCFKFFVVIFLLLSGYDLQAQDVITKLNILHKLSKCVIRSVCQTTIATVPLKNPVAACLIHPRPVQFDLLILLQLRSICRTLVCRQGNGRSVNSVFVLLIRRFPVHHDNARRHTNLS